ncbi:hypothetical protein AcW1_005071 [Taiwanofungus camphoratus]|nr:hypothetical protein AcW1_005071 [Antrodia cinnamomea]
MPPSSALQWTLIALPLAVLLAYVLTAFPPASSPLHIHPSLAALPPHSPSWHIYPEHFFPGGAYVELPHGTVRYWLVGPHNGTRVVLIHGLSVPAIIWKDVAPALAASGFRVLLYDLYGRGYSDAPQTTYDAGLYTTQLALLMQYVGWDHAHLAGVSMGGGIAAAFAAHFPHLAGARIALVASTGLLDPSEISRTSKFLSSPPMQLLTASYPFRVRALSILLLHPAVCGVGTRLTRASYFFFYPFGSAVLRLRRSGRLCIAHGLLCLRVWLPPDRLRHVPSARLTPLSILNLPRALGQLYLQHLASSKPSDDPIAELIRIQSAYLPGFNPAVASSLRDGPVRNLAPAFRALGERAEREREGARVLLIWGTADPVVPLPNAARVQALVPRAQLVTLPGAGHDVTVSHPEEVVRELVQFFGEGG